MDDYDFVDDMILNPELDFISPKESLPRDRQRVLLNFGGCTEYGCYYRGQWYLKDGSSIDPPTGWQYV